MKKLKWKSFKALLPYLIIAVGVAAVFLPKGVVDMAKGIQGPVNLEDVDYSDDIDGLYVTGTITWIYDYYCDTEKDNVLKSREYIIDGGENYYMGMYVESKDMAEPEAMLEAVYAYYENEEDDGAAVLDRQFEVTGVIRPIPEEELGLYHDYMEWDSMTAEEQALHLPYYIKVNEKIGLTSFDTWLFLLFGGAGLVCAICMLARFLSGSYQKNVTAYIKNSSSQDQALSRVEAFYAQARKEGGMLYTDEFIGGQAGAKTVFQKAEQLLWAYQSTTTRKRNGFTVGKTHTLMLGFADGSLDAIDMGSEAEVQSALSVIQENYPWAVLGYTEELKQQFKKDMPAFRRLQYDAAMAEHQSGMGM